MNQPVRAYPFGQGGLDTQQKGLKGQINLSPKMKLKLQPISDSSTFMQMSPVLLTKLGTVGQQGFNNAQYIQLKINILKKSLKIQQSESFSPNKKGLGLAISESGIKIIRVAQDKKDNKLPYIQDQSPVKTPSTNRKNNYTIQDKSEIAKQGTKEFFSNKINGKKLESDQSRNYQLKTEKSETPLNGSNNKFFPTSERYGVSSIKNQITPHIRSSSNPSLVKNENDEDGASIINFLVQKTQAGFNAQKQQKTNQDSVFCNQQFSGYKNRYYLGVCDGHGVFGHYVSQIIKKILPQNLDSFLKQSVLKSGSSELGSKEESQVLKSFSQAFTKTNKEINSCGVDVTFSGTTAVTVLIQGQNVWCANVGDSRAVIFFQKEGVWNIQPLSNDHKPDLPAEKKRILQAKGRVEPFFTPDGQPVGPSRVWLSKEQIPGLAMSRSFGDYVASTVGVVADPEVTYFKIDFSNGFIVIASDGVWEFLTNERVCEIIQTATQDKGSVSNQIMENIANNLVKESTRCWQEEDEVIDDISCILAHIQC